MNFSLSQLTNFYIKQTGINIRLPLFTHFPCAPKAGVTGSTPVGRAIQINGLGLY